MSSYFEAARGNEVVFRNVLRDLKENKAERPMGIYIPEDLETEVELETIFEKYSSEVGYGMFTITNFAVSEGIATVEFQHLATMSGGGASLKYFVLADTVEYWEKEYTFRS